MKQIWIVSGLVVAALGTSALIVGGRALFGDEPAPATATQELPWQVTALPGGGSQVLGLSVLHSLPWPLLLAVLGHQWSRAGEPGKFSHSLGLALGALAISLWLLSLLRVLVVPPQRLLPGDSRLRQGLGHKVHGGWRRRRHRRCCRSGFGRQVVCSLGGLDLGHG